MFNEININQSKTIKTNGRENEINNRIKNSNNNDKDRTMAGNSIKPNNNIKWKKRKRNSDRIKEC